MIRSNEEIGGQRPYDMQGHGVHESYICISGHSGRGARGAGAGSHHHSHQLLRARGTDAFDVDADATCLALLIIKKYLKKNIKAAARLPAGGGGGDRVQFHRLGRRVDIENRESRTKRLGLGNYNGLGDREGIIYLLGKKKGRGRRQAIII